VRRCRRRFTITTKTPFQATELEARVWVAAMFLAITSSKDISSVVVARRLGISETTGWKIGHAIRQMMDPKDAWKR
jgi:hypothetical protein